MTPALRSLLIKVLGMVHDGTAVQWAESNITNLNVRIRALFEACRYGLQNKRVSKKRSPYQASPHILHLIFYCTLSYLEQNLS